MDNQSTSHHYNLIYNQARSGAYVRDHAVTTVYVLCTCLDWQIDANHCRCCAYIDSEWVCVGGKPWGTLRGNEENNEVPLEEVRQWGSSWGKQWGNEEASMMRRRACGGDLTDLIQCTHHTKAYTPAPHTTPRRILQLQDCGCQRWLSSQVLVTYLLSSDSSGVIAFTLRPWRASLILWADSSSRARTWRQYLSQRL